MCIRDRYEAGEKELAQKIARRFCRKVVRDGFALCHYPFGREDLVLESPDFNLAFGSDILLATSWTVSYTHLDVYKRQVLIHSRSPDIM